MSGSHLEFRKLHNLTTNITSEVLNVGLKNSFRTEGNTEE